MRRWLVALALLTACSSRADELDGSVDAPPPHDGGRDARFPGFDASRGMDLGTPRDAGTPTDALDDRPDAPFFVLDGGPLPDCVSSAECPLGEWCQTPPGHCDAPGTCVPVDLPLSCPSGGEKVCGCDDQTFENACFAAQQPVSVASAGDCRIGAACASNADCTPSELCIPTDHSCGGAGTCQPRSLATCRRGSCFAECGCDDVTYASLCLLRRAGVVRAHEGVCDGGVTPCSPPVGCCGAGGVCPAGEECTPGGRCAPEHFAGTCWSNVDCGTRGLVCWDPHVCPCGATCSGPDAPGRCDWPDLGVPDAG